MRLDYTTKLAGDASSVDRISFELRRRVAAAAPRLLLLTAPAGYGKTTFIAAYAEQFAVVHVCDCDAVPDLTELARRVTQSLAQSPAAAARVAAAGLAQWNRSEDGSAWRDIAVAEWRAQSGRRLFVFENADALAAVPGALGLAQELIARSGADQCVAICSRNPLPLNLTRVLRPHEVLRIAASDLALSDERIRALALEEGVALDRVDEIVRLSEGWPIAVHLLLRLERESKLLKLRFALEGVAFDDLFDYLAEHVVATLPVPVFDALLVCAAVPRPTREDIALVLGAPFDESAQRAFEGLQFVSRTAQAEYQLHPLLAALLRRRFESRLGGILEISFERRKSRGDFVRAAQIALARGNYREAAQALDSAPTYLDDAALSDCEEVVAHLDADTICGFPNLWVATIPFRRFAVDLDAYVREAETVYFCGAVTADDGRRLGVLLHLASALYQTGRHAESEEIVTEAFHDLAPEQLEARAKLLTFVASLRGLQGRYAEARALRREAEAIRRPDFLSDLALDYVEAHAAFARGRYARGLTIVDESLRRMKNAKLPLYVAYSATNAAIFAWANGDDDRFAQYVATLEAALTPSIERGFAFMLDAARGNRESASSGFEWPILRAIGHLYRIGHAPDRPSAVAAARDAAREADVCRDPYVQVLAHSAVHVLDPQAGTAAGDALRAAVSRIESPELRAAVDALLDGREDVGILGPYVQTRLLKSQRSAPRPSIEIFGGRVVAGQNELRIRGKELELLVLLAMRRSPVSSIEIADAIWSTDDLRSAANNVKVTVSRARQKLGRRAVLYVGGGYRLDPTIAVDVREIEAALRAARTALPLSDVQRGRLVDAHRRMRGGVPALYGRFDWFEPHRSRLLELRAETISALARNALALEQPAEALDFARELTQDDPLDEVGREIAVRSLAALDDLPGALREARAYEALLASELCAAPSPAFRAVVDSLRQRGAATV
jgi:DNA-binding SARP family transcriptional activator/tetratricopeptide (TPR) repeat protein